MTGPRDVAQGGQEEPSGTLASTSVDEVDEPSDSGDSAGSSMLVTGLGGVGELLATLGVGYLTSRYLFADGRGEYTAIVLWVLTAGWMGSFGLRESIVWVLKKNPDEEKAIVGSVLALLLVLGLVTTGLVELLVPLGFREQTPEAVRLAKVAGLSTFVIMGFYALQGMLAARENFKALAWSQMLHPVAVFCIMRGLYVFGEFDVASAVATKLAVVATISVVGLAWTIRLTGIGRPSYALAREMMVFGSKLQVYNLGQISNGQLDLVILPAVVEASEIGHYSVAVLTASTIIVVFGRISSVVLPLVARAERAEGLLLLERILRVVLVASLASAVVLALIARPFFVFVFGDEFSDSVQPLILLLPGIIAWSVNMNASAGLQAMDLPGRTSWSQLGATVVTIIGLAISLEPFGILGAAVTSTCAYLTALCISITFLVRDCGFPALRVLAFTRLPSDIKILAQKVKPGGGDDEPTDHSPDAPAAGDPNDPELSPA